MALIFLGTSNCIINGSWVEHVRNTSDEEVINASIGASPSRLSLYQVSTISIGRNDVAILDYTVTEAVFQASYWNVSADTIIKDITSVVDYLYRRGCYIIMMLNPDFLAFRGENVFESVHLKCAAMLALPVLNITELFRRATNVGGSYRQMMQDNSHCSVISAPVIAETILQAVTKVRKNRLLPALNGQPVWLPRVIHLASMVPLEQRLTISSSLRTTDMAAMQLGDKLKLEIHAGEFMLGLVVNMGGKGARIKIVSDHVVEIRDLIFDYVNDNPRAAMAWFTPIRNSIEGSKDGVHLHVVPFDPTDGPPHEIARPVVMDLVYDEVPIEGILVGRERSASLTEIVGGSYVDLLEASYQTWAVALAKATQDAPICEFSF